jgi:multisubunit Na+/H+ antiporter MnhB subunit
MGRIKNGGGFGLKAALQRQETYIGQTIVINLYKLMLIKVCVKIFYFDLPIFGKTELATATIFDTGVALAVIGTAVTIILTISDDRS